MTAVEVLSIEPHSGLLHFPIHSVCMTLISLVWTGHVILVPIWIVIYISLGDNFDTSNVDFFSNIASSNIMRDDVTKSANF